MKSIKRFTIRIVDKNNRRYPMLNEKIRAEILGGSLTDYKTDMAGKYRGFYTTFGLVGGAYTLEIYASSENDPSNAGLYDYLQKLKAENSKTVSSAVTREYSFQIIFKTPSFSNKIPAMVNDVAEPVVSWLITNGYRTGCWACGTDDGTVEHYVVNGTSYFLCPKCANEFEKELVNRQVEKKSQNSKTVPGIIGAFLGGLIGVVLWVLIYRVGYIAGIAGLVTVVCAMKGYEMLGGCLDKKGVIITTVMSLALIYLANHISWSWEIFDAFNEYDMGWTFGEIFGQLHYILGELDATGAFFGDMAIGALLSVVASVTRIIAAFRENSGTFSMEKK